jgi:L-threonylcarbamoyladenylate synthase
MKRLDLGEVGRKEAFWEAAKTIRSGGIVLYPTDTVYGLGCDPFSDQAIGQLTELKGRPPAHPYLVLVANTGAISKLVSKLPPSFDFFTKRLWPGPVTMIFDKHRNKRPFPESDSIGIRCPHWSFLREFLETLQTPIISTSANRSGKPPIRDPDEAVAQFKKGVDLILDLGKLPDRRPSTILDIRSDPPEILREGAMLQRVQNALREWRDMKTHRKGMQKGTGA